MVITTSEFMSDEGIVESIQDTNTHPDDPAEMMLMLKRHAIVLPLRKPREM